MPILLRNSRYVLTPPRRALHWSQPEPSTKWLQATWLGSLYGRSMAPPPKDSDCLEWEWLTGVLFTPSFSEWKSRLGNVTVCLLGRKDLLSPCLCLSWGCRNCGKPEINCSCRNSHTLPDWSHAGTHAHSLTGPSTEFKQCLNRSFQLCIIICLLESPSLHFYFWDQTQTRYLIHLRRNSNPPQPHTSHRRPHTHTPHSLHLTPPTSTPWAPIP